ncbi:MULTISPECIES: peptidoglycan editing factor PgeF [unclassified Leisingera]|uniref:peptidoglycan editing factor PgeF n=1 Tax=unclassified Leisingera TaxID=2614906 RepID=UPI0002F328F3|nr:MULTISPECIES: peptidoglycan editing factor PgeF [unclassified Leisingera]KIC23107.1 polyphenol oxidase [Leisingera sp. ANG-S3]KIC49456.1 polyphenol oxidase [Leisingera sp. ANG-S]KID09497.1 polyphenol oxidase [Leisingera sp. ANG1]
MTLEILTSDLLGPVRHGFFTRRGGASSGIYRGLNCGLGSTDQREAVQINRNRVAAAMEVPPENLSAVHQVHSADVQVVKEPSQERPQADAMVTNVPGLALSILTADCQPVLFSDPDAGVIGAAHAGWRGTLDGVLEATLEAMEGLGARRENTAAVIGPTISQRAYEVGPEFFDDFMMQDDAYARFFANGEGDRYLFDLPGLGLHKLRQAGIGAAEWSRHCTYSDAEKFFSFRRATHAKEADYGRLISCIRL